MLKTEIPRFYKVKSGQTLKAIAAAFGVSEYALVKCNRLREEPYAGRILEIPQARGDAYVARAEDGKVLLCGSEERFSQRNGTDILYPGMRVIL